MRKLILLSAAALLFAAACTKEQATESAAVQNDNCAVKEVEQILTKAESSVTSTSATALDMYKHLFIKVIPKYGVLPFFYGVLSQAEKDAQNRYLLDPSQLTGHFYPNNTTWSKLDAEDLEIHFSGASNEDCVIKPSVRLDTTDIIKCWSYENKLFKLFIPTNYDDSLYVDDVYYSTVSIVNTKEVNSSTDKEQNFGITCKDKDGGIFTGTVNSSYNGKLWSMNKLTTTCYSTGGPVFDFSMVGLKDALNEEYACTLIVEDDLCFQTKLSGISDLAVVLLAGSVLETTDTTEIKNLEASFQKFNEDKSISFYYKNNYQGWIELQIVEENGAYFVNPVFVYEANGERHSYGKAIGNTYSIIKKIYDLYCLITGKDVL